MAKKGTRRKSAAREESTSSASSGFDITHIKKPVTMRRSDPRAAAIEGDDPFPDGYATQDMISGVDTDDDAEVGQRVTRRSKLERS